MKKEGVSRWIWRAIGFACLISTGITAIFWLDSAKLIIPLNEGVAFNEGTTVSIPIKLWGSANSKADIMRVAFEDSDGELLSCEEIDKLNVRWKISESKNNYSKIDIISSSELEGYTCNSLNGEDKLGIRFVLPTFENNKKYYFHLSTSHRREPATKLTALIAVYPSSGLSVQYIYNDMAVYEIIGAILMIAGFVCFLVDLAIIYNSKKSNI